jgi:uncharacterized protein YabN with tetrapyrrole methylase and pyrophosphatase domain
VCSSDLLMSLEEMDALWNEAKTKELNQSI